MALGRWLKHGLATTLQVRQLLPPAALARIREAIAHAETNHSGEIRLAVEAALPWSYLRRNAPARERATMVFAKLRVWDTEHNNGVLIYVNLADRAIEIVADRGIARHVPKREWEAVYAQMRGHFAERHFEAGVIAGIEAVGVLLARHFPAADGDARNELSDRPVIL